MLNRKFTFNENTEINGIEETSQLNSNETLLANTYDSLHSFVNSLRVILDKDKGDAESFNDSTTDILDNISILIKLILDNFISSYSAFVENSTSFKTMYHASNINQNDLKNIIIKYLTPELTLQIQTMLEMFGKSDVKETFVNKYDNNKIPLDDVKNLLIKIMLEFYNSIRKAGPQFVCRYLIDIIENELKYLEENNGICVTNDLLKTDTTYVTLYSGSNNNETLKKEYTTSYKSTLISIAINLRNVLSNTTEPYISSQEIEKMNSTNIKTSVAYSIIQDILMKARCVCSEYQNPSYENFITYQTIFSQNPEFLTLLAQLSKHEITFMEIVGKTYEILKVAPSIPKILNTVGQMITNTSAMFSMTIPNKFRNEEYPIDESEETKISIDTMFKEIYKLCVVNSFSNSMDTATQNVVKDKFSKFGFMLSKIIDGTRESKHEGPIILSFRILYLSVLISRIYIQEALFFNGEDKNESIETLFKLKMSTEEIIEYFKEFGIQIDKYMVEQYQKWLDALYTKLKEFTQGSSSLSDRKVAEMVLKLYILLLGRVATYLNNENHKILQIKLRTGIATAEKKFLKAVVNVKEESRSYEMRLKQLTAKNRDSIDNGFTEIPLGDALKEIIKDQQISNLKIKYCCIFVLSTYQRFIPGNEDTIYDILGFDFAELNNFSFDY